ncbi:MAG: right-handed parallel beta-helix repeat-containing protein, partial [Promethearchaeota archaeon]
MGILSFLLVSISQVSANPQVQATSASELVGIHDIVEINGVNSSQDWDECPYITGKGTQNNPYLLENLVIDAQQGLYGIHIEQTDAYLIIRNCTVFNQFGYYRDSGSISLEYSNNVIVEGCTLTKNAKGLYTGFGLSITIRQCNFTQNTEYGLYIYSSNNNTYEGNYFTHNGYYALYDHNSRNDILQQNIIENSFQQGLGIFEGVNHMIIQNIIRNCSNIGLGIDKRLGNKVYFNQIVDNKIGVRVGMATSQNHIYMNAISNNTEYNAYSESYANSFWDNGTHGNYWGDYE